MTRKTLEILSAYEEYWTLGEADIEYLKKKWIINWIGSGEYKLSSLFFAIAELPLFDKEKSVKLVEDIEIKLSIPHDIEFTIWWNYIDFTASNIRFASWLSDLLNWTSALKKYIIVATTFIILQWQWTKYFNFK